MRTIPELRAEMRIAADRYDAAGLPDLAWRVREWERDLYRRSPVRRAKPSSYLRPDPGEIVAFAEEHPDLSYMEIAACFDCSTGRVSEALAGFRADA